MTERKKETFIYEGLGFPILLVNVPMKKVYGEWCIDINFNILHTTVLKMLAEKPTHLTGGEIRFIMDYFELSIRDFAKEFGVTHPTVLKWLNDKSKMNPSTEFKLRTYIVLYRLKVSDKEFRKFSSSLYYNTFPKRKSEDDLFKIKGSELLAS